ncbi:MAG: T9SS type A sorting domain-containing protein [Bacteroidetes bacterium]|nr:MAG: T9SS type A sorting domain-containing protein [Bacteroidota bacterium]
MKYYLSGIILMFVFIRNANAQCDTMVINLINNKVEKIAVSQIQCMKFDSLTVIDGNTQNKNIFTLKGNYPNPFQTHTFLEFELTTNGNVEIIIYDNNGNQIQKIKCDNCQAGKNTLQWNCNDALGNRVQNGTYYYEVLFNNLIQTKKMILIR